MALEKFDFSYNRAWQDGIKYNTLVTQFESGKEQRRFKSLPRRKFQLNFEKQNMTNTEAQNIWDFFKARKGRYGSFLWDYKKSDGTVEEVTVRFAQDELNRDVFMETLYNHGLKLIEVI